MSEWWLSRGDGRTEGPLPTQALVQGIVAGQIPRQAYVCRVGDQQWVRVAQVDEIWEAVSPDSLETKVIDRPWFLNAPDSNQAALPDIDWDNDGTRVLTPQPIIAPKGAELPVVSPHLVSPAHREPPARQRPPIATKPARAISQFGSESDSTATRYRMRPKMPTLDGISDSNPPPVAAGASVAHLDTPTNAIARVTTQSTATRLQPPSSARPSFAAKGPMSPLGPMRSAQIAIAPPGLAPFGVRPFGSTPSSSAATGHVPGTPSQGILPGISQLPSAPQPGVLAAPAIAKDCPTDPQVSPRLQSNPGRTSCGSGHAPASPPANALAKPDMPAQSAGPQPQQRTSPAQLKASASTREFPQPHVSAHAAPVHPQAPMRPSLSHSVAIFPNEARVPVATANARASLSTDENAAAARPNESPHRSAGKGPSVLLPSGDDDETVIVHSPAQSGPRPPLASHSQSAEQAFGSDDETTKILSCRPAAGLQLPQSRQTLPEQLCPVQLRIPPPFVPSPPAPSSDEASSTSPLVSDPSELLEEVDDEPPFPDLPMSLPLPDASRRPTRDAKQMVRNTSAKVISSPPSTPPPARHPRQSAASIVLSPEPIVHQEATQPAARALHQRVTSRLSAAAPLVLVLAAVMVAFAIFYLLLR
jgi:hypothetical protein